MNGPTGLRYGKPVASLVEPTAMPATTSQPIGLELQAWSYSMLLHGALIVLCLSKPFLPTMHLAPEPFRWDISLIDAPLLASSNLAPDSSAASPAASTPELMPAPIAPPFFKALVGTQQPVEQQQPSTAQAAAERPTDPSRLSRSGPVSITQDQPLPNPPVPERTGPEETASAQATTLDSAPGTVLHADHQEVPLSSDEQKTGPTNHPPEIVANTAAQSIAQPPAMTASLSGQAGSPPRAEAVQLTAPVPPPAATATITQGGPVRADYGWLQRSLSKRLEELKRQHRPLLHQEKKVKILVRAVVTDQGLLADATVEQGSGEAWLDEAALALVRNAFPMPLERQFDRPQIAMKIPIVYQWEH